MSEEREPFKERLGLLMRFLLGFLIQFPILFIPAWTLIWAEGWVWIGVFLIYATRLVVYLLKNDVELLKKRTTFKLPKQIWERYIMYGFVVTIGLVWIIPGLDYQLNWSTNTSTGVMSWTNIIWWVELIGIIGVGCSLLIIYNVMKHNSYLARIVEIQGKARHRMITTGPYRVLRHPMYAAFILLMLSVPLLLGSYYALIPGCLTGVLFVFRTILEDKILHEELAGYSEYAQKTRYKLIPGIW
ncbi:MAG: isoprenylcysteine carboxylmethyltransferase family protein [Promethearchaeota archaeon]|nr:MAG: isoprenylcysteine carboxylmethyltransferase family protein [Candidatus Lokiarchaeota archaeon]